jgi:DNA-binding CsgD family transcriptional regulator/PAS domain-containing protein
VTAPRTALELIPKIYDALGNHQAWAAVLGEFARLQKAQMAVLVWHDPENERYIGQVSYEMPDEYRTLYRDYYGRCDEWFKGGAGKITPGWVGTGQMLCSDELLVRSEFYCDYLRKYDVFYQCGAILSQTKAASSAISLLRPKRRGAFRDSNVATLRLLLPHLQRAVQIQQKVAELNARSVSLESAIDHMNVGIVFVDSKGKVLHFNTRAEELLRRNDGLSLTQKHLRASSARESSELQSMTVMAAQTSGGSGLSAGGTIFISRKSGRPLSVTVAPLRNISFGFAQPPSAVLFISDPDQRLEVPKDVLQRCYGLTGAEARLAMLMLDGRSLNEAADIFGVTHNTAKTHLKNIFGKTQVQRQGELIRLLLRSFPQYSPDFSKKL